jgi:hypothetical protein
MLFKQCIKNLLIQTNSWKIAERLSRVYYRWAIATFVIVFKRYSIIESIFLRNSLTTQEWVPWESDIDFTIILKNTKREEEALFLESFWRAYRIICIFFPVIKHIDIFTAEELDSEIMALQEPQLCYLVRGMHLLYGVEKKKSYCTENISFLRIDDWEQSSRWFYEDNFSHKIYTRKYYRFFSKIISTVDALDGNYHVKSLNDILGLMKEASFYPKNAEDIILCGFYHVLGILDSIYKSLPFWRHASSIQPGYTVIQAKETLPTYFLRQTEALAHCLSPYAGHIQSIFIAPHSLQNNFFKLYIIIKEEITQVDFVNLGKQIKNKSVSVFSPSLVTYIISERTLNLFLNSQRLWIFEGVHLVVSARTILGENILNRLKIPSEELMISMLRSSIAVYRNWSKNALNGFVSYDDCLKCLMATLSWKIFLDSGAIITTQHDLVAICKKQYQQEDTEVLFNLINERILDKKKVYYCINSLLDEIADLCETRLAKYHSFSGSHV